MTDDDLHTRVVLLERTAVSKDHLAERDDKLLQRFDAMMQRYMTQFTDEQRHQFRIFGHEVADQLRASEKKMQDEMDQREAPAKTGDPPKRGLRQHAVDLASGKHGGDLKWIGYGMIAIAVMGIMYVPWLKHFLPW